MGWGFHPDTLSIAGAQGAADRSGHKEGSADYLQAYRDAYEARARGDGLRGLDEMLANLDAGIAELRAIEAGDITAPAPDPVADAFALFGAKVYRPGKGVAQ